MLILHAHHSLHMTHLKGIRLSSLQRQRYLIDGLHFQLADLQEEVVDRVHIPKIETP
jgi:hypothetical protein